MSFDVIIATYNRRESLRILVEQILECALLPEKIIIVDSSADEDNDIQNFDKVQYIRSSYCNQPYQRYVGFVASSSPILFYFDDDMRITNKDCFNEILKYYSSSNIVAVQPNFEYQHLFLDEKMPKSKLREASKKNTFVRFVKFLSGIPNLDLGRFWLAGLRGGDPKDRQIMEYFKGPVFSVRRDKIYKNFNFNLFNLYQSKNGKGEDAILGFNVSKQGKIVFCEKSFFYHDDQNNSSYSVNIYEYNKKIAYSRFYLSLEYARLQKTSKFLAFTHYNIYSIGRLLAMLVNQLINFKKVRIQSFNGYFSGYLLGLVDFHKINRMVSKNTWKDRALNDINNSNGVEDQC